jgi:hypothetical protein
MGVGPDRPKQKPPKQQINKREKCRKMDRLSKNKKRKIKSKADGIIV